MRGFRAPQVNFVHESLIDELATQMKMDPFKLRMKNCFDLGSATATGQVLIRAWTERHHGEGKGDV